MNERVSLSETASAKINLGLSVIGKRSDGYHALESLVTFAGIGDRVDVAPASGLTLAYEGAFAGALQASLGDGEEDLVLRAARAFHEAADPRAGAALTLRKSLPLGAGLGGGSADAAACLRLLNRFWELNWPVRDLVDFGARIGSDVPACLLNAPCWMTGRGERVQKLSEFPGSFCVLVHPGRHLSTAEMFRGLNRPEIKSVPASGPPVVRNYEALVTHVRDTGNDLVQPAMAQVPMLRAILDALRDAGADIASMTGSGSACFGLFKTSEAVERAGGRMKDLHPEFWTVSTRLLGAS